MLPGPRGTGEKALQKPGPSAGNDQGEAWNSGEEALGEPGPPSQDRHTWPPLRPRSHLDWEASGEAQVNSSCPLASRQPQTLSPSRTQREQLPPCHRPGLANEQYTGATVPFSPQMAWEVAPSRMTLLSPWDANYEAKARSQLVWGGSCGSGASFSSRTLCHPSFWPLYEASGRGPRLLAPSPGHQNREQLPGDAGVPVMCCEDVFLLDPLLPRGQRVPLYLSEAPQQAMGSLKLLLPPPVMSSSAQPSPSQVCSTTWLSGPELIALTGLLQMSQGEPRSDSSAAPQAPAGHTAPVADHPGPSGGQSCSRSTDPVLPHTSDTHCP